MFNGMDEGGDYDPETDADSGELLSEIMLTIKDGYMECQTAVNILQVMAKTAEICGGVDLVPLTMCKMYHRMGFTILDYLNENLEDEAEALGFVVACMSDPKMTQSMRYAIRNVLKDAMTYPALSFVNTREN